MTVQAHTPTVEVQWLEGLQDFQTVWAAMQDYTRQRDADSPDQIWLLQHHPVYTLGQAGRTEHVLNPGRIPIVKTDRGGQVTYHGPGQLVAYCLFDLRRYGLYVKSYVALLEGVIIDTLNHFGAHYACVQPGAPGVYVPAAVVNAAQPVASPAQNAPAGQGPQAGPGTPATLADAGEKGGHLDSELVKIAALGVKINRGCTYHGVAINVDMNLDPFAGINPCGYAGLVTTDLAHCRIPTTVTQVGEQFAARLQQAFSNLKDA